MEFWVWGLGVWGLGVWGLGFGAWGFGFGACGFSFRVSVFGFSGFGFRFSGFGFRFSGFGFRVLGFGSRVSWLKLGALGGDSLKGTLLLDAERLVSGFEFRVKDVGFGICRSAWRKTHPRTTPPAATTKP